jgi:adenylyltransferase/sulfurtransferase
VQLGWSLDVLKGLRCLVVGAGALGNEVIKNLALLGVGTIVVIDMDTIEDSNLTRSVLFRERDIGKPKAIVAANSARSMDSSVRTIPIVEKFQNCIGSGGFYDFDVIFGCLDSIQARIDLSKNCMLTNRLYIDAGLRGIDGDLKVFGDGYEVCFDCLLSKELRNEAWRRHSCLKLRTRDGDDPVGPTAPTISSIIAGLQVQYAVKYVHGQEIPLNHRISVHGHLNDFTVTRLKRNQHCPTHFNYDVIDPVKIIPLDLSALTATGSDLYQAISADMGSDATIDMEFDLVMDALCKSHKHRNIILKRQGTIYEDEILCPECLSEGKEKLDARMVMSTYNQITGDEPFLDRRLSDLRIAPKSIIKAFQLNEGKINVRHYLLQDNCF